MDYDRSVAAYLKFFTRPTQKRLDRTAWLIGQQMHTWLPGLAAAPLVWADTRHARRPPDATLDFAGYLARAVPGKTWLELKNSINDNSLPFPEDFRWRCVRDLVLALAVLEQEGIVHGDLSPNNVVIDLDARPDQPALYLIDFDAFVAAAAGGERSRHGGRGRHLRHRGLLPAGPGRGGCRGRWFRGALFGPLRARHAAGGTAHHGLRPVAGRSSLKLEWRPASAPLRGLAGPRRSQRLCRPCPTWTRRPSSRWRNKIGRPRRSLPPVWVCRCRRSDCCDAYGGRGVPRRRCLAIPWPPRTSNA